VFRRGQKPLGQLVPPPRFRVEPAGGHADPLAGPPVQLPAASLSPPQDPGDLRIPVSERLAEHEGGAFRRGEPLHEHEQRERNRFPLLGVVKRAGRAVTGQHRLW